MSAVGPSFRENVDVEHATGHSDVAPTVLAALGLPIPPSVEGRPILEALRPEVAAVATAAGTGRRLVGEMVHEVREASRVLEDGRVYRQALTIGFEKGGPSVGRCVSATFEREAAVALSAGDVAAKL